jgi:hypothetical protein
MTSPTIDPTADFGTFELDPRITVGPSQIS